MLQIYVIQLASIEIALSFSSISQPMVHQFEKSWCPSSRGGPEVSKTPQRVKFGCFWAKIWKFKENTYVKVSQNHAISIDAKCMALVIWSMHWTQAAGSTV